LELFVKILRKQESGYSGEKPNQRGKYILIPQPSLDFFPPLATAVLNDAKTILMHTLSRHEVALNIVYHNAKFFPELLSRAHNEVRIYRNSFIDSALNLDKDVIIVMVRKDVDKYSIDSILPSDEDYSYWHKVAKHIEKIGPLKIDDVERSKRLDALLELNADTQNAYYMLNRHEVIKEASAIFKKAREQQPGYDEDPCKIMSALFKTQKDFSDYLRMIYENKCALRKTSLVADSPVGLEAAHIKGHAVGGPLLPSNGFLLSVDLHRCFDLGVFNLDDENKVRIHKSIDKKSEIFQFEGYVIEPMEGFELCKPFYKYNRYHRDIHFN
jgi:hypothetical protein